MTGQSEITQDAIAIWKAGVAAVDTRLLVRDRIQIVDSVLEVSGHKFPLEKLDRLIVLGFGKASGVMALGLEQAIEDSNCSRHDLPKVIGQVNVPDDKIVKTTWIDVVGCRPAGANLPTERVVSATERIVNLISSSTKRDLVICLISGGGSALLESPTESITLDSIRATTIFLSRSGADIHELNRVRSCISRVKGGGLLTTTGEAPIVSLIVSDFIGDTLEMIASGPTVRPSCSISAVDVLTKYDPTEKQIPSSVWNRVRADAPEIKVGQRIEHAVIGNIETAMNAAATKAKALGYEIKSRTVKANEGDAEMVGRKVAGEVVSSLADNAKQCFLVGGETTVNVCENPGDGGRNQHLILATIDELIERDARTDADFCILSGGTDGEDGTKPVAGAFVNNIVLEALKSKPTNSLSRTASLKACRSHDFHLANKTLFDSGPTNTNVCDLRISLTDNS